MTQREIDDAGLQFHPVERVVIGIIVGTVSVYVIVGLCVLCMK